MQNVTDIRLEDLAGGAINELAQGAFEKVFENMRDVSTPWKPKRTITITLDFTQNEDRDDITMRTSVKAKTEPVRPMATKFAVGKDLRSGQIYIEEYGPQIKGQMTLGDYMAAPQTVETDAGTNKVTDFRAKEA